MVLVQTGKHLANLAALVVKAAADHVSFKVTRLRCFIERVITKNGISVLSQVKAGSIKHSCFDESPAFGDQFISFVELVATLDVKFLNLPIGAHPLYGNLAKRQRNLAHFHQSICAVGRARKHDIVTEREV